MEEVAVVIDLILVNINAEVNMCNSCLPFGLVSLQPLVVAAVVRTDQGLQT